jgi:hypothetical protein
MTKELGTRDLPGDRGIRSLVVLSKTLLEQRVISVGQWSCATRWR